MGDRRNSISKRNLNSSVNANTSASLSPTNTANLPTPASTAESAYDVIRSGVPSGHRRMASAPVTPVVQAQTLSRTDAGLQSPIGKADKPGAAKKLHLTLLPAVSDQSPGAAPSTTPRKPAHGVPVLPLVPSSARGPADIASPFSGAKGAQHSPASPRPSVPPGDLPPQLPTFVPPPADAPPPLSLPGSQGKPDSLSIGMGASTGDIVSGTEAPNDGSLAAQIEQMADDVVTAEVEQMQRKSPSDMAGMAGKENLHRHGKPVYTPVRQFLMTEFEKDKRFIAEVKKQGGLVMQVFAQDPDSMRQKSGNDIGGAANKVNIEAFKPYTQPIFHIVCGERLDYRDSSLSPATKRLLEAIDGKLHAELLKNKKLSLREIEKIRANLFKGILFTRGISPFLLKAHDGDNAEEVKTVKEVNKNWSAAANRNFNLDYKEFAKSFVRHGNENLSGESEELYKARKDEIKAKRAQELMATKRSKNPKARSQPTLPQGEDFRRALQLEKQRHKAEPVRPRDDEGDDSPQGTIDSYRALYAENWTGTEKARFEKFYDSRVKKWMNAHGDDCDIGALESELKAILREFRSRHKESSVQSNSSSSTPSTTNSLPKAAPSSSATPLSPRGAVREKYGIAETAKRQRQREATSEKNLQDFLKRPDCANDFEDERFKQAFVTAAWADFDPDRSAKDAPAILRRVFEEQLVAHFKRYKIPTAQSEEHVGKHPRMKQLDDGIAAWKEAQGDNGRMLNSEVLSSLWMRLENEATMIATFKTVVSNQDKSAIGRFKSFDAVIQRWRKKPENVQKPLTEEVLQKLWSEESPLKSPTSAESGRGVPQSPLSSEAERRAAQERARERMRDQLKEFLKDPANKDFVKQGFERAFLDSAIKLKSTSGLAALTPDKLKQLYTDTQITRYWASRKEAGWPDSVRDAFAIQVRARCFEAGNHVATEEHFEDYRRRAMDNALGEMLNSFLRGRSSLDFMDATEKFSFRKAVSDRLRTWIHNGALGKVHEQIQATYQDKLLEQFMQHKKAEGKGQKLVLLHSYMANWRKQHCDEVLEWDALERIYESLTDTGFLDELTQSSH
ncbi:hypothetical protein [Noviherbaspirillum pedocola]|uniref:Uncharacterized protein n=1 Tax=Noviherbaspirillum pedocola TaxID=2801341 RepID=A0A934SPM9_9BURK|nr:hypothetical protein [Noviherbaspirillum pedocola]MBK4733159.1 hypothetical protein [Noviherbaspirillum pedocola]